MIINVLNSGHLNQFNLENHGSFQQSWEWGELQEAMGRSVKRVMLLDKNNPQLAATFVKHKLPFGKHYWLCPQGPIARTPQVFTDKLHELMENLSGIFARVEPGWFTGANQPSISNLKRAPHDHNPRATILINLERSESEILDNIRPKHRYNIRLAEKKQIRIKKQKSSIEKFLNLLKQTATRDRFRLHPLEYYKKLLQLSFIELFGAYSQNRLIATAIVAVWGQRATYLHGASDYEHRGLMAPHLLHWEIIKVLKKHGLKYYDLGGVSSKDNLIPGWQGLSRFKEGFGGKYHESVGSLDYIKSPFWYFTYKIGRNIL